MVDVSESGAQPLMAEARPRSASRKILIVATILGGTLAAFIGVGIANADFVRFGRALGDDATDSPEGEACASGIAIDVSLGLLDEAGVPDHGLAMVCTEFCLSNRDCPEGWGCRAVPQGNGESAYLCFPRRSGGLNTTSPDR